MAGPYEVVAGAIGSGAPSVAATTGGTAYVFWKGTNGNLWEAHGPADPADGGLSAVDFSATGTLGSGPAAGIDGSGHIAVYWEGLGNMHLWKAYWNGGSWSGPGEQIAATLGAGGPWVAVTPGGTAYVFWEGTDGNIWEAQGAAAGGLGAAGDHGLGQIGSAPTAGSNSSGDVYVFWQGAGNEHLWEGDWAGSAMAANSWTERAAITVAGGAPAVAISG